MKKKITRILKAILFLLTVAAIGFACYAQVTVAGENLLTYPTQWGFFLARSYRWFTLGAVMLSVISIAVLWAGAVHKRRAARRQAKTVEPKKGRIPSDDVKSAAEAEEVSAPQGDAQPKEPPPRKADPNPADTKATVIPMTHGQQEWAEAPERVDKKMSASGPVPISQPTMKKEDPLRREPEKRPVSSRPEVPQKEPEAPIPAAKKTSEPISTAQKPAQADAPRAAAPKKIDSERPEGRPEQNARTSVQQEARFCKKCGEPRTPGARFCKRCGYRF